MMSIQPLQDYFDTGVTRSYSFRKQQLKCLRNAVLAWEQRLNRALKLDLHKSTEESYATEIGFVLSEITHAIKNLKRWMAPSKVSTPLALFPSQSRIIRDPHGVVLIIAPWNYPFNLSIAPLVGAIAAGNCAVIKPSELAIHTSVAVAEMIREYFPTQYISVVEGDGSVVIPALVQQNRFDYIFFTGSIPVGKAIARLAAEKLVPTTLELGGKSPCIVDANADINKAAARIVWGKFTNAGQTCVAPDYLLCHAAVKNRLIDALKQTITKFYGKDPSASKDYARIINHKHFDRIVAYMHEGEVIAGGVTDRENKYIAPTILDNVKPGASLMREEIFGPVLPVISFTDREEALNIVRRNSNPLSIYIFSSDNAFQDYFVENLSFGGGCINNTLVHLANAELPFGGVANSGLGQYHGKYSYETFSRPKSLLKTATWIDPSLKYPPYSGKLWLLKKFLR